MRDFWLVSKHEYQRTVLRRSFVLVTLAIPLGMVAIIALAILVELMSLNDLPVGYVDNAGILDVTRQPGSTTPAGVEIRAFSDEGAALSALESEGIQVFFVIPSGYPDTLQTDVYYLEKPPSDDVWSYFNDFVRANLVAAYPDDVQHRLLEGPNIAVYDVASHREFGERSFINMIMPFVATFFFFFATMLVSSRMLHVVADEKESRMMEVMITTVTPGQLIGGKTLGLLAAALSQLAIYVTAVVVGLVIAAPYVEAVQHVTVPWTYLGVMALFFFPAYAFIAALMVSVGAGVTKVQEAQQVAGFLNMLFTAPVLLAMFILKNPAAPLPVFLTLFPTTSFLTISLRWGLGTVPVWQIVVSWVLLVATLIFTVWAAARIFRAGMLRYGQPLSLKAAVVVIRGG